MAAKRCGHLTSGTSLDKKRIYYLKLNGKTLYRRTCLLQVKVLGTLAMVDDGEADWKMIVIGGDC
jgi:inorganic pyrophosphatase